MTPLTTSAIITHRLSQSQTVVHRTHRSSRQMELLWQSQVPSILRKCSIFSNYLIQQFSYISLNNLKFAKQACNVAFSVVLQWNVTILHGHLDGIFLLLIFYRCFLMGDGYPWPFVRSSFCGQPHFLVPCPIQEMGISPRTGVTPSKDKSTPSQDRGTLPGWGPIVPGLINPGDSSKVIVDLSMV